MRRTIRASRRSTAGVLSALLLACVLPAATARCSCAAGWTRSGAGMVHPGLLLWWNLMPWHLP